MNQSKFTYIIVIFCLSFNIVIAQIEVTKEIPSHQILEEIKAHTNGIAIWWTGHNGNPKYAVYYGANLEDCGYLITMGGKRLLQMGEKIEID